MCFYPDSRTHRQVTILTVCHSGPKLENKLYYYVESGSHGSSMLRGTKSEIYMTYYKQEVFIEAVSVSSPFMSISARRSPYFHAARVWGISLIFLVTRFIHTYLKQRLEEHVEDALQNVTALYWIFYMLKLTSDKYNRTESSQFRDAFIHSEHRKTGHIQSFL